MTSPTMLSYLRLVNPFSFPTSTPTLLPWLLFFVPCCIELEIQNSPFFVMHHIMKIKNISIWLVFCDLTLPNVPFSFTAKNI